MGSGSGCLVTVATTGSKLDVDGSDVELLETVDDVDGGLHGCVGGRLVAVSLDFHSTSNSRESFAAGEIGNVDEGIVPGGEDVADGEHVSASILRTQRSFLLGLGSLLSAFLSFASFLLGLLDGSHRGLSSFYFSHNIN